MRSFVLILLVATSAFADPSVDVTQYSINEILSLPGSGRIVDRPLINNALEISDQADTNIYVLTLQQILGDLADQLDAKSQAMAVAQTIAMLGVISAGRPGDSCAAANAINSYASGKSASSFRRVLAQNIDTIVQAVSNPRSMRNKSGPVGGCVGGGRDYKFEAAWDRLLSVASPYTIGLLNEEYCATKRLFTATNVLSNNVAAAALASACTAVEPGLNVPLLANFLRSCAAGSCNLQLAAQSKALLIS